MRRRQFLAYAALTAGTAWLPRLGAAAPPSSPSWGDRRPGSLVLVELKGGNDGLNTLVPYADPEYHRLRPTLAIARDQVLALDEHLGLNPALKPLWSSWQDRELAWVLGVGYDHPNRSHFRSIDIWETGSESHEVLREGWITRGLPVAEPGASRDLPDVVILGGEDGPAQGGALQVVSLKDPEQMVQEAVRLKPADASGQTPEALTHLLSVRRQIRQAGTEFQGYLKQARELAAPFPETSLGRQLQQVARMLVAGMDIPVFKVTIGSFDTHTGQRARHDRLLTQLAEALAAFRQVLRAADRWDRVVIMSYSEFGRRVAENASRGTDHGAAAPHFVLGGPVKGGLYGEQPSLTRLNQGDLEYRVDYRRLYQTIASRWWGHPIGDWQPRHPPLAFL